MMSRPALCLSHMPGLFCPSKQSSITIIDAPTFSPREFELTGCLSEDNPKVELTREHRDNFATPGDALLDQSVQFLLQ
jgi:hypothetical protein